MRTHSHFSDLVAHDDADLARLLGAGVVSRETINEWPLSWVQRIHLDDGRQLVYKSQTPPTVEPEFYRRASSPLLPGYRLLDSLGSCSTMVIDWIEAPLLSGLELGDAAFVEHACQVVEQIGEISGELPVYLDLGTPAAWRAVCAETFGKLRKLVHTGQFPSITPGQIDAVQAWAESEPVVARIAAGTRVTHGDLRADQIFLAPDGYRVVDWQRPILGPPDVDLVMLLDQHGVDPLPYAGAEVVGIRWFVILRWAVEAQHDLLPKLGGVFDEWAADATLRILG